MTPTAISPVELVLGALLFTAFGSVIGLLLCSARPDIVEWVNGLLEEEDRG